MYKFTKLALPSDAIDELPTYDGDYSATPSFSEQTIATKNKVMLDDFTVEAIPIFTSSNTSGGTTVYIGREV